MIIILYIIILMHTGFDQVCVDILRAVLTEIIWLGLGLGLDLRLILVGNLCQVLLL